MAQGIPPPSSVILTHNEAHQHQADHQGYVHGHAMRVIEALRVEDAHARAESGGQGGEAVGKG